MTCSSRPIRVAVTGGPGAGKTSLLEALARRGYAVVPEVARRIIADRTARGLTRRPPPIEFATAIVEGDIDQYESAGTAAGLVFFDRSLLDSLGMLTELNQLPDGKMRRLLERYPYHPTAFILPPWPEIYHTDSERDQSFEQAVAVYHSVRAWYVRCGYAVIDVPRETVDRRCEFVLRSLADRPVPSSVPLPSVG
jgi:predicted ATPase